MNCWWITAATAVLLCISYTDTGLLTFPGAPPVTFNQYAGYYEVSTGRFMHYIFVESQNDPATDPLLLWLTGGPGCSGISALLTEFGPYNVDPSGQTLSVNPWSWNRIANLLIFESPPGVGYSYVTSGNLSTNDEQTALENYNALVKFFQEFPQFQTNDFYVTGESYGGIYVPTLVQTITDMQFIFKINLKGMTIGNGCVSDNDDVDTLMLFMYYHGMIGEEHLWNLVRNRCCNGTAYSCPFHEFDEKTFCGLFVQNQFNRAWSSGVNPYNMYASCANGDSEIQLRKRYAHEYYMKTGKKISVENSTIPCMNETSLTIYMNQESVRQALFVPESLPPWDVCSELVGEEYNRIYDDMQSRVRNAVNTGLHVLLYNGDIDMACNFLLGQRFSNRLGLNQTSSKKAYEVDGQVGGYMTRYGRLSYATVRGAGHMVPTDKPRVAFYIISNFLEETRSNNETLMNSAPSLLSRTTALLRISLLIITSVLMEF